MIHFKVGGYYKETSPSYNNDVVWFKIVELSTTISNSATVICGGDGGDSYCPGLHYNWHLYPVRPYDRKEAYQEEVSKLEGLFKVGE